MYINNRGLIQNEIILKRKLKYRYTPYGESRVKEEGVYNPYQYTGRRYDEESDQYYYRARMYDPEQARFLSNDPAEDGGNLYRYAQNNPTNKRDPSGKTSLGDLIWCVRNCYEDYLVCRYGVSQSYGQISGCIYDADRCISRCYYTYWGPYITEYMADIGLDYQLPRPGSPTYKRWVPVPKY